MAAKKTDGKDSMIAGNNAKRLQDKLFREAKALKNTQTVREKVDARLAEFGSFRDRRTETWFSELCFCILTANSKARTAIAIQDELGSEGFIKARADRICETIRYNKHRFHNNKTRFIMEARKHKDIKHKVCRMVDKNAEEKENNNKTGTTKTSAKKREQCEHEAREWLVGNIKGISYKEASHFLRNVGYKHLAILDRHILNLMHEYGFLKERPKTLNRQKYLEIEKIFKDMAKKVGMSMPELDMYMWYMKTVEVLK